MAVKVEISRKLLIGMGGIASAAVLGLVFLLGRESVRGTAGRFQQQANSPSAPGAPASASPKLAEPAPAPVSRSWQETPNSAAMQAEGVAPAIEPKQPPFSERAAPNPPGAVEILSPDPMRAAVAAYFKAVEYMQPASQGGNPESMAQEVVAGLGKGDMSGFDDMIKQAQETRRRLSGIAPPQPCTAYHRESLASLDAGLDLMKAMQKALSSSGQESQVLNLADQANALKARSEALQLQEKTLKQRYGLMK